MTIPTTPFRARAFGVLLAASVMTASQYCRTADGGEPRSPADLVRAYPDFVKGVEGNLLFWRDGATTLIDDGTPPKDFQTVLVRPDIKDMFLIPYVVGRPHAVPRVNDDPGRIRNEDFFRRMYGDCRKGEVVKQLRSVKWLHAWGGGSVKVTTINHVADRLEDVIAELQALPDAFKPYLIPNAGTYTCRDIAGTSRTSMHSYGAAIDINLKYSDYWRWPKPRQYPIPYTNRIPYEIVDIFERHGFIWGGKWYHYDTMHFEYRPELLPAP